MPVGVLVIYGSGYIARITRASMAEVMGSPFIRTAILKGMPYRRVIMKHALRGKFLTLALPAVCADNAGDGNNVAISVVVIGRYCCGIFFRLSRVRFAFVGGGIQTSFRLSYGDPYL